MGFYKKWNVIYSQILSLVIVNVITYLQIALIDKKFHSPSIIGGILVVQIIVAVVWAFAFQFIYSRLFPRRQMLLVYGERPILSSDAENQHQGRYNLPFATSYITAKESIRLWSCQKTMTR